MDVVELSWSKPNGYVKFVAPVLGEKFSGKVELFSASLEKQTAVVNGFLRAQLGGGPEVRITKVDLETWTIHFTSEPEQEKAGVSKEDLDGAWKDFANFLRENTPSAFADAVLGKDEAEPVESEIPTVQDWAAKKSGIKSVPQEPGVEDYLAMLPSRNIDLIHPLQVALILGGDHNPEDLRSYDAIGLRTRSVNCSCGLAEVVFAEIQDRYSESPYLEVHIDAGTSVPIYMDGDLENFAASVASFLEHLHKNNCDN